MARLSPFHVALLLVLATATAQYAEDDSSEEATSTDCPKEAARFRPLRKYTYSYEAEVGSGVEGAAPNRAGFRLQCKVELEVPERCAFVLRVKDCALHEATSTGPDGRPIYSQIRRSELQQSLSRFELGFRTSYGSVATLFPHSDEPEAVLNVKRGIIAALMPPPTGEGDRDSRVLPSVHGSCPTEVTVTARKGIVPSEVTLTRDLRSCDSPVGKGATASPLALVSGLTTFATSLFASTQECTYSLDSRRKAVSEVTCTERHMFLPFSNRGKSGAVSTVKQTLKMTEQAKSNIRNFDVNEKNGRELTYEPQATDAAGEDPQRVLSTLAEMVELGTGADNKRQAELFASLLAGLRALSNGTLFEILPRLLESSSSITLQSLPQCGTAPCYSALLQLLRSNRVPPALSGVVAYALGFHPAPCTMVVRDTLTLAQAAPTRASMLALSMVVHRHFTTHKQVGPELQDVAAFVRSQLGADCSGDEDKTYLALKAAGNMGGALQAADGAVVDTLAACVGNTQLPLPVQIAAIQALRRTQLTEGTRTALLDAYRNSRAPVQRRIAAYLALMSQPEPALLWDVLNTLPREENKQLRSYVVSHVEALRTSKGPAASALREKLEQVISGMELPASYAYSSLKYSRRMSASRVVRLPGAEHPVAGTVQLDVILEPSGFLPRSVVLETSLDVLGESLDVFEIGVEGQGFEAPLEALFGPKGFFPNSAMSAAFWVDGKLPEQLAAVLRKWTGVNPDQRKQNIDLPKEMLGTMQKLMQEVNLQKLPMEASAFLRVMGTELGYVRHSDIKMLIGFATMAGRGLQALPKQILSALAGGVEADLFVHYVFMDNDVTVPTGAGLPLRLASTGSLVAGAKVKASMRPGEARRASAAPSISLEVVSSMEVLLPGGVARAGLHSATSLYHESALGVAVQATGGELRVTLTPPQKTNRLLSFGNQLRLLHRQRVETLPSIEENREQWQSCRPLVFGVSLCQSGAYSNASYIEAAPWFPLTGATRFEISTEPADGVTEYSAIAALYSQAGQENLQFKVQATGTGETKELGSILMLDRDRHRIQWDLDLPSCPGCLRVEVGVDDESDARLNQGGYAASFNVSYQEQREAFLLARIRQTVTDARSLLLQYSAGVPRLGLHGNYVARASLGQDDRIVVNAEMTGAGPFSSASYGSEVVYDLDRVQAQLSAEASSDPKGALEALRDGLAYIDVPSPDEYRLQLQRTLNAMLEGRVAQTDMTLRHIVVKSLEAMDMWIKKSTNNGNWNLSQLKRLQTQLSRGQEITVPSLSEFINIEMPHRTFVSSAVTVGYQFNKQSWTLQIPVPMGGRMTDPVRLLPRTLRTPALRIAPLGINVAPRQFTMQPVYLPGLGMVDSIPAFKVPERVTLKVPLFGELSVDAKVKSNMYNWTASAHIANVVGDEEDTSEIRVRSGVTAVCPCDMLSYVFNGYTALSQKHWSAFEIRTDNTITSQLLNLTTSYKSTADMSEGLNVKTEFTNRVATGLLTTTANVVASATGDATQSSFTGELAASAELPRGIRAKVASSSSGTVNFQTRDHMLNGELRVDSDFHSLAATWRSDYDGSRYSMVASNDLTVGADLKSRNRVELQSGLRADKLAVRTELAFREENVTNVLSVMWDGRLFHMQDTLQGRLLGSSFTHASTFDAGEERASFSGQTDGLFGGVGVTSKLDAAYATGALRLSTENKAECARGRFDHMLTAGVTAEGLEVSVETSLVGAPGRAAYKASLVVDAAGAGGSANAVVTSGRVMLETTAEGSARASGLKVTTNTVGRAVGSKVQHNAEGRLDGGGLVLVSAYSGQILETDSSSTVNFELNRAGLSFVTKTVASYAENKVDHGCNLKVAPWSVDLTAVDEVKVLGASFSNQVAAKAGFLTASVSGSASGDFSGNEVRHTYKLGYADLAGSASFDTVANLNGGKLQNQLSLEFAGLAGKVGATTTCETPALKFSNVARGAALPYSLSYEVITDSQGSLSAYGEHMGSLSNKFFVQAEPLALVLSNEYRGSTQHEVAGGSHVSLLRHKLGAQVNPTEQSADWELTAELNDNRYVQKLEAQNDPLSVGAKLSAQSTVNLGFLDINIQTPALMLPFLNVARPARSYNVISSLGLDRAVISSPQDFSVQASVSYDKNQDVHVISIPFVESLPALYEQLRNCIRAVLDNMRNSLTRQEIQRYYQQYQRVLDEIPGKINNAIDQLELKNKVKHVQGQLLLALQNYDPRDFSAQELMESFRHFSRNVASWVKRVLFYPLSALDSDKVKESIQLYIEQAVRRVKEFDREYGFTDTLMKAIEQLMDNVRNMDLSELTSGGRYMQEKVIQALDDLKQWLQRFDVDRAARQIQEAIRSVDVREVLARMEQVIFVEMQKKMEKIASYLENFMTTYRVREMVQNGKKNLMQFVENYEVSENLNIIRDTLVGLDSEYQLSAKAQRMVRDMKAIDLKGYLEKLSQAVNSISQKLTSMDYPAFIKSLNELLKVALEHVESFDYNQFVVTANLWLREQTAMVNNKLQEFNIPERVQQLRERVNTVSSYLSGYMQSFSMRDVEAYVTDCVSALFEKPAVRQVANWVLEYVEYVRLRMEETDIQAEMQKFWKGATASISDVARSIAEFDINAAVTDAVEQLNTLAVSLDIQEVIQKILRYLEEGFIIPRFKLFGHVFHRTEVSLRALRRMQISTYIYTPPLFVPFTSLYLSPDLIDLKTLSSIEMPTRISLPAFTFLGKFHVEPITIDFQKIKQQIIEFLDKIRNMDMATVHRAIQDSTAQMGELTLNDIPFEKYLVVPEFRFPEISMPEFNLPQLNLDDIKFIKMPEFQLPRIPHEMQLPALGKLNANLKVMSPFYTLTATAGLHNSTEVYGSPALRSFANAQATSTSSLLAFAVSTEARLSAPRLQRLELSANAKLTHDLCGLTHSSDVTVDRSGATAQFNTQASAKSAPYTGEANSVVTFTLNRAVTWEATGSYRHVLDVPAADTAGSMNVRSTAKLMVQGTKLEADVVTTGEAQGTVYGASHEGTHKAEARLRVDGAVLLLSGKVDSVEKFGSLKHEATLEVVPFDRVVYAHNGDTVLTGVGRGSVQVNAKVQGLRVDVTVRHSAVGTKLTSGKMTSATTFHAEPFQLLLTSNTLGGGKLQLPLRLTAKVEVVNNFTVSLAPDAQHADWTFGSDFNQYRYLHDASVDNNAERAGARISVSGNANLEFLRKEVSLPSVLLPYTNYRTPEVRNFQIWERTGLGALLRTPQQTLNVTAQLQYAKNKEWHTVRLPFVPALHYAVERSRHVANAAFERYRDATLQWAREAYDETRAMGADNVPKRFTVPGFTVPLLNMEVSPYTVELPDMSILVAQSYRTPRVYLPLVGYRVPSYELSLPRVNLPPMKIPGALRRLSLPEISLRTLPTALHLPAMGNLTYDFTFRCSAIAVAINSGVYNQSDIVAKLSASSASEHTILNGELSAAATLSRKRGIKLSTVLALSHRAAQVSHSGVAVVNKRVGELTSDTAVKVDMPYLRVDFKQAVNASTRQRPHVRVRHVLSYKVTALELEADLSGRLEHNGTAEVAWLSLSLDSNFAGATQFKQSSSANAFSCKLDNMANLYVDQRGVRSALRNEAQSKASHASGLAWDVSGKQEADLEMSPLRLYAIAKHMGRNQLRGAGAFSTQGTQTTEARLEFVQWELKGLAKGEASQGSSLMPKAASKQSLSLAVSAEKQQVAWTGEAQLGSVAYAHEAALSNERARARCSFDASLQGHAAFLKGVMLPVYGRSLWDVLKMDVTTKTRDVQVLRAASSVEYTKNLNGYVLALPVMSEGNGYKVSIPEIRLRVPEFVKQIPAAIQAVLRDVFDSVVAGPPMFINIPAFRVPFIEMSLGPYTIDIDNLAALFDFPEEFTVPTFRVPLFDVYVPAYTVRLWDITLPTVFVTQSFRVPFTSIVVPPYRVDLRNIQVPKMLRVPSFAFELPALPRIPMPQLDVTLEYVAMEDYKVPYFQLIVPAFRVEIQSFTLPKELKIPAFSFLGLDSPNYVLRLDDVFSYVANFELPTLTLPAVSMEVPALRLALPTAVTLPAFGSLVGSAKVQSPVYNVTCSYSSFAGEDPDALLIIDATASSTLRFLEFDVDVISKISPKEDGSEMRTQASLSHPELTVELLEVLTFSDSETSEMYEATIDVLSPSLTDASMRLSYGNARARMSMSSPSLGFLGFVAERQSPQVLSAQVYARDTASPESDVQLALLTLSLNTPDILGVESHWKGGMAHDAASLVRRSAPRAARSLYSIVDKYHTEHLGLTLEEFPSRAQESLDASKENLRSAILRAREAVEPIPDRLRSLIQELLGKVGVFAEQMQLNLVTAIRNIQEGIRPSLRQLAKRASDLVVRIDVGLKDGFEKASEALEVFAKWLKQTRLQIASSNKYYTVERLFSSALQVTTEAGEAILEALRVAYHNLYLQLNQLEFREPFTGQLVKGSDLTAALDSSIGYAADRAALAYQSLDVKAAYRDAYSKASSLADDAKRAYSSAVNYDYAAGASRAMLSLRDTEQLRYIHHMTQEFFVVIGDAVKVALDELNRYYNAIVETARAIQRKYLEGTALDLNLKYWEVEGRAVALVRTVLDYFRQMGPKYYQDGLSLVQKLAFELSEVASAVNLDRPEKMGAKAMELSAHAKRAVERFVVAITAKLGEVSASAGDRVVRLSAEARERIREAYERFAESYDGLMERASRALDSSLERYAGLARSLVEFLRRLPRAVSGALADYAVVRPGRLSLRLPQGVVSWRSFDELPRLRDEAMSGINSTVAIGRQIINERLAQTRALISANLAVLEKTMEDAIPKLRQGVNDAKAIVDNALWFAMDPTVYIGLPTLDDFPPFKASAMVFADGDYMVTFDGRVVETPQLPGGRCAFLLAHDFLDQNFTLVKLQGLIALRLPTTVLYMTSAGAVSVDTPSNKINIPYVDGSSGVSVTREGDLVLVETSAGASVRIDTVRRTFLFELSGWYHGRTLGLLGTNDHEPTTDMMISNGFQASDTAAFFSSWEMTGASECASVRVVPSSRRQLSSPRCKHLLDKMNTSSPFNPCFKELDPSEFLSLCQKGSDICPTSTAYRMLCEQKGIDLSNPDDCARCNRKRLQDLWMVNGAPSADVLFVIDQSNKLQQAKVKGLLQAVDESFSAQGIKDARYGLVTFGGRDSDGRPQVNAVRGEVWTSATNMKRALSGMEFTGASGTPAYDALVAAAGYDFQPEAARLVVLVAEFDQVASFLSSVDLANVDHLLKSNGVVLSVLSDYRALRKSGGAKSALVGLTGDGQPISGKGGPWAGGDDEVVPLPRGDYVKLVRSTNGAVFSVDALRTDVDATAVGQAIAGYAGRNVAQRKECSCVRNEHGRGKVQCRYAS
ncbi:unnamed protein product [Lampetra fluviatilis]